MKEHIPIEVSNGLDDFKVALYVCPNRMNDDKKIQSNTGTYIAIVTLQNIHFHI